MFNSFPNTLWSRMSERDHVARAALSAICGRNRPATEPDALNTVMNDRGLTVAVIECRANMYAILTAFLYQLLKQICDVELLKKTKEATFSIRYNFLSHNELQKNSIILKCLKIDYEKSYFWSFCKIWVKYYKNLGNYSNCAEFVFENAAKLTYLLIKKFSASAFKTFQMHWNHQTNGPFRTNMTWSWHSGSNPKFAVNTSRGLHAIKFGVAG